MVKDHSDSERGNLLMPHGLLFPISSKEWPVPVPLLVVQHWAGMRNSSMGLEIGSQISKFILNMT